MNPVQALEGLRVVDFCWVLAGPLGTRILANFGAEVIRVESQGRPDSVRAGVGPDGRPHPDLGELYNDANTGKLSLTLDLRDERAREALRRLIATADVVTNNYRPGALERMGFGYAELQELKPDIILLNMPGTHRRGPWSATRTMGNIVMGASGFNHLTGFPGQRPRGLGVAYPDFTSPYLLVTTVLAALRERQRSGHGQELDLSQLSATIALLGVEWMQYRATGRQPARRANRDPNWCPHAVYPTRGDDEWCAVAVRGEAQWAALGEAMGRPDLATDARFATHAARKAREDALDEIICEWTRSRDRWELAASLQERGIAAAPVESVRDALEVDPQLRDHYQRVRQPSRPDVEITLDGEAIRFAGFPNPLRRAPMLGEHSEHVLCDLLGLPRDEYQRLLQSGAIR